MNLRGRGGAIISVVSFLICIYATHAASPEARDGKQWKTERNKNPLFQKKLQSNDTAKKLETDRSLVYVDNSGGGDSLNDLIVRAESEYGKRGRYANSNTKLSRNRRVIITLTTLGALGGGTAVIVGILLLRFFRWMFLTQANGSTTTFMSFIMSLIRRVVGFFPGGMGILNILGFGASAVTTNNGKTQIPFWLQFQQQSTPHHTFSPNNIGLISNILHWYSNGNGKRHEYDSENYPTDHYNNYNSYNSYNYASDYEKHPSDYDYLYPSGDAGVYPSGSDSDSFGYDYSTDKKNPRVEINQYYQTYPNNQNLMTKRPRVTTDWTSTTDPWGSDVQSFTDDVENQSSMLWPLLYPGQLKDAPTAFDRPLTSTVGGGLTKSQIIVTGPTKVVVSAGTMYIVFPDPISGETKQIPYDNAYPKYTDPTTKIVYITYNEVKTGNTYIIPQNAQFRCTESFRKQFRRC